MGSKMNLLLCLGLFLMSLGVAVAKPVEMEGGNITFNAPDDFAPLTPDQIAKKFPQRNGPMDAVGNASGSVTICYQVTATDLQPGQLSEAQQGIGGMLGRVVPGIQWVKNDIVEINGTKWIYFEMTSAADQGEIHNIEITTSYHGKMFVMNFNSAAEDFDKYQGELRKSLNSVKVKNSPAAPSPSTAN